MMKVLIRTTTPPPDEFSSAFPNFARHDHAPSTMLMGDVMPPRKLQAVLDRLDALGIRLIEVLTVPDD